MVVLTDRLNSSERLQSDIEKKNFIKNIISPRMRDFFRVSNLVYLAPIRDNSSKHKWFRFLTFKINSSLVRKVSQNLKKKKKILGLVFFTRVSSVLLCVTSDFFYSLLNRSWTLAFQSRSFRPQTKQSWPAEHIPELICLVLYHMSTSFWINIKWCMPWLYMHFVVYTHFPVAMCMQRKHAQYWLERLETTVRFRKEHNLCFVIV